MIHVIASIQVKPGRLQEFMAIFVANVPEVRAEDGCLDYVPTVDADASLAVQLKEENVVTVIEKWRDVPALHAHLQAPHMLAYREAVKDLVDKTVVKVLADASGA